jgi:hypothetical protein
MKLEGARSQSLERALCPLDLFLDTLPPGKREGMPTEPAPVTVSEVVHRAVEACDDGTSEALDDLLARFEDDDEPIAAIEDMDTRLDLMFGPRDEDDDPPFLMACAIIVYLAYRRDEVGADATELLRLAVRAEYDGHPPPRVASWLAQRGVSF